MILMRIVVLVVVLLVALVGAQQAPCAPPDQAQCRSQCAAKMDSVRRCGVNPATCALEVACQCDDLFARCQRECPVGIRQCECAQGRPAIVCAGAPEPAAASKLRCGVFVVCSVSVFRFCRCGARRLRLLASLRDPPARLLVWAAVPLCLSPHSVLLALRVLICRMFCLCSFKIHPHC